MEIINQLRIAGLLDGPAEMRPLLGGVSSDIQVVEAGGRRFVVKTALAKLRVKDDWFAEVSRNAVEQDFFTYAAGIGPDSIPEILGGNPAQGWFAMEYLGEGFTTWKSRLLAADAQPSHARRAGEFLGRLHRASWCDRAVRDRFSTLDNFHALRLEPYLLTSAQRLPAVRAELVAEAGRLAASEIALVHGDYSPKNIMIGAERLVVLDAECAWFGDPAFDAAFLLTHLFLKALLHAMHPDALLASANEFWTAYTAALGSHFTSDLEARTTRLLLCLMLARVHGKSPVDYLPSGACDGVTAFGVRHLPRPPPSVAAMMDQWRTALSRR